MQNISWTPRGRQMAGRGERLQCQILTKLAAITFETGRLSERESMRASLQCVGSQDQLRSCSTKIIRRLTTAATTLPPSWSASLVAATYLPHPGFLSCLTARRWVAIRHSSVPIGVRQQTRTMSAASVLARASRGAATRAPWSALRTQDAVA